MLERAHQPELLTEAVSNGVSEDVFVDDFSISKLRQRQLRPEQPSMAHSAPKGHPSQLSPAEHKFQPKSFSQGAHVRRLLLTLFVIFPPNVIL